MARELPHPRAGEKPVLLKGIGFKPFPKVSNLEYLRTRGREGADPDESMAPGL